MELLTAPSFPVLTALSVVLLVVHVLLQGQMANIELGSDWNAGPRDEGRKPKGRIAGRAERASKNFQETYPAFVGLALALAIVAPVSPLGHAGALIWFAARLVYIPLYLGGVAYIRSLAWAVAMLGLLLMCIAVIF